MKTHEPLKTSATMKLIDDWRWVLRRAWSMRLAVLAACLSASEVAIQILAPAFPTGRFAALAGLVSLAAAVARLIQQGRPAQ